MFVSCFQINLGLIQSFNIFSHLLSILSQYLKSTQDNLPFLGPRKNAWLVYGDKAFAGVFHSVLCEESSSLSSFLSPVSSCSPLPSKRNVPPHLALLFPASLCDLQLLLFKSSHSTPSLQSSVYRKLLYNFPVTRSQDPSVILSPL